MEGATGIGALTGLVFPDKLGFTGTVPIQQA
jgi:hypothetical protein